MQQLPWIAEPLAQALQHARGHALLVHGPAGVGQFEAGYELARALLCESEPAPPLACGQCAACRLVASHTHPDLRVLLPEATALALGWDGDAADDAPADDAGSGKKRQPSKEIRIEQVRAVLDFSALTRARGRSKVVLVYPAERMNGITANALLKTLEEPPDYLKFVLATTDPEKMLPTVLSRCLQFNLRPMPPEVVYSHLQAVLQAENVVVDSGSLRLLSRAARGSMRDALSLTDQAIAYGAGQLQEAGVRAMLGSVDRQHAARLVQALAVRDGAAVLATVNELRNNGLSAAGTLEEMAALLQQMAVEQAVPGALDDTDPDTAGARHLATQLAADETQLLYSIVLHGRAELNLVSDDYAALTMVLLRLLAFPAAGPAPAMTGNRAAPLQAAPREARTSASVARPIAAPPPKAMPSMPSVAKPASAVAPASVPTASGAAASAPVTTPPAVSRPAPVSARPATPAVVAASMPTQAPVHVSTSQPAPAASRVVTATPPRASDEPPPWLDDEMPDDVESAGSAGPGSVELPEDYAEPVAKPIAAPVAAPAPIKLVTTAMGDRWAEMLRPVVASGSIVALVRELALQAELIAVEQREGFTFWRLRVERESLRTNALRDKLQTALQSAIDPMLKLELEAGVPIDSVSKRDAAEREAAQREAEQLIQGDPAVRALMAQFRTARIVPGSIKPIAEPRNPTP